MENDTKNQALVESIFYDISKIIKDGGADQRRMNYILANYLSTKYTFIGTVPPGPISDLSDQKALFEKERHGVIVWVDPKVELPIPDEPVILLMFNPIRCGLFFVSTLTLNVEGTGVAGWDGPEDYIGVGEAAAWAYIK